jgi:hypothetical protein
MQERSHVFASGGICSMNDNSWMKWRDEYNGVKLEVPGAQTYYCNVRGLIFQPSVPIFLHTFPCLYIFLLSVVLNQNLV